MKVTVNQRGNKNGLNGSHEVIEIVGKRVTVRLTNGKKTDIDLKDVQSIDGSITFGKTDGDAAVESNDETPSTPAAPEAAPLFDAPVATDGEGEAPAPAKKGK